MQKKKEVEVAAAIIQHDDKILCVQRGENKLEYISKKYEFPGGKVEEGETRSQTVVREIKEELNMDINAVEEFLTVRHEYPDFILTMYSFMCTCEDSTVELSEHIDFKWLAKNELSQLDWAAADVPIVEKLIQ